MKALDYIKCSTMEGIHYVTDSNNRRVAVQIDLVKHGEIWEDFYDGLMAELSKDEASIPLEELGKQLQEEGLLDEV